MFRALRFLFLGFCLFFINFLFVDSSLDSRSHSDQIVPETVDQNCSAICLKNNGYAIFGGNMDWADSDAGLIYLNPRDLHKTGYLYGTTGRNAQWTARYASITFSLVAYQIPWGGMNEKGICFSTMSGRGWTTYEPADQRPPLNSGHWFQYALDTCATIDEVIAATEQIRIVTLDHYLITDRYGDQIVLEFIAGQRVVHRGESLPVAVSANSPYEACVDHWNFKRQNGYMDTRDTSVIRFVTAADMVDAFQQTDIESAIDYAFDTLHSVRGEQYSSHTSQWSIVFDTKNMRVWYRTARHRNIRYLDLYDFDLDCDAPVKMLDVQANLEDRISDDFKNIDYDQSLDLYRNFCRDWGIGISESELRGIMTLFESYQCTTTEPNEEIIISSGFENLNTNPRCAVNPTNGDVLVVWEQHDTNTNSVRAVRSAMLKRSLTGRYQMADFGILSSTDNYNANPFPAYDKVNKRFIVVWDQSNPENPASRSDIMGRIVSITGIPEAQAFKVISNGARNETPQLLSHQNNSASQVSDSDASEISMLYSLQVFNGNRLKKSDIFRARLGKEYRVNSAKRLMRGGMKRVNRKKVPQKISLNGFVSVIDHFTILPVHHEMIDDDGSVAPRRKIVVIEDLDSVVDFDTIDQPGSDSTKICAFETFAGEMIVLASCLKGKKVINYGMSLAENGTLVPDFKKDVRKGISDTGFLIFNSRTFAQAYMNSSIRCQLFVSNNGNVYWQTLSDTGELAGSSVKLFAHDGNMESMFCVDTAQKKSYELFFLWQKRISEQQHHIVGRAFPLTY